MIQHELKELVNPEKAKVLQGFFKTGKGEYGEGDVFLGITMPQIRVVAKKHFKEISFSEVQKLISSKYHEFRMCGLVILVYKYEKFANQRKEIYNLYLNNTKFINNWDLVDVTTPKIVGSYLLNKDRSVLYQLVRSSDLWERRIAVLATFMFIRENDFDDCITFSEMLLSDNHDLMHKSVGWMLREIGKRDVNVLENFLDKHLKQMPRTMLRYAIEKFPEKQRKEYLKK